MKLVAQWQRIQADLPAEWADARLALSVGNEAQRTRAAALLGPANPGRTGDALRFDTYVDGGRLRAFAAVTLNGTSFNKINVAIAGDAAPYLRVTKTGAVWSFARQEL